MRQDYRRLRRPAVVYGLLGVTVALLIAVLFSPPLKNAHRWLRFGLLSFQPSEMAKLTLVLTLAYQLEKRRERMEEFFAGLFPPLVVTACRRLSGAYRAGFRHCDHPRLHRLFLFFVSGAPLRYLVEIGLAAVPVLYLLVVRVDYRRQRLLAFLDPFEDPLGRGFQIIQSLIAVGTGGVWGVGLHAERPEAVLSSRASYGFHLLRHRRRAGAGWNAGGRGSILGHSLARTGHRSAGSRSFWNFAGRWVDDSRRGTSVHQYRGYPGNSAHHRDPAALFFRGRLLTGDILGGGGIAVSRYLSMRGEGWGGA